MKYILVTGGVISGVGKGVIASSFGTILKHCGIHVTSIKIDPYINIDAGTFSPYEHGEVYVLDDGGEVDLDLGNYERFLDVTLHKDNNITTGKIYQSVIEKERRGEYLGKTVQVVPHITDAVQEWVERVANHSVSEDGNKPEPRSTGEPKTKPTQSSVRELRGLGLSPDLIICRSENPIGDTIKDKISNFCHVPPEQVITIHDLSSIYRVPLLMESQGVIPFLSDRLQLNVGIQQPRNFMRKWRDLAERIEHLRKEVVIALVGKYTKLEDSYASVTKALQHASVQVGYKLKLKYIEACNLEKTKLQSDPVIYYEAWQQLCKSDGVVVPGGFGKRGMEGKIKACKWCRTNNTPFLGICLGMQAAVIEFARDVLHLSNANSTEIDNETENPLVIDMPEHNQGQMGGTMRLGKRRTRFSGENSVIKQLYGNKNSVEERHRHRYEINPKYVGDLQAAGMKFVGHDEQSERMEIVELEGHSYYVATQYHPEYLSRPLKPSPPFLGLILASVGKLKSYLSSGCRFSPAQLSDNDFDDDYPVESTNSLKVVSSTKPTNSNVSGSD
ncbi:CTP synthase-like isoform X2 [Belonocnema kinseyi]|uniref:CTP synthase-like isoform X2 n=1 Tax=Belonocnema kinseyi TaxID=2817044 RepID=UPI00143D6937|nr:CTP synthase-like isoform X2 [Belonocnema kinseyi]